MAIVDRARISADPVCMLSQNITANPTTELLKVEKSCPDQMIANVRFQFSFIEVITTFKGKS